MTGNMDPCKWVNFEIKHFVQCPSNFNYLVAKHVRCTPNKKCFVTITCPCLWMKTENDLNNITPKNHMYTQSTVGQQTLVSDLYFICGLHVD